MTSQALNLYEVLKKAVNEDSAKAVVQYLQENMEAITIKQVEKKIEHLATKEDLLKVETSLDKKLSETKAELMKWMFLFIMGQTALLIGLIKFIR